jgi:CRISPR-associated protein (TIGR02584 family)
MADVLVSPLGRSPGAVSGVYFALQERGFEIGQVVTIGTSHPDVKATASNYLAPLFGSLERVDYDPVHIPAQDLRDGKRNVSPYVAMVGLALENAHGDDHQVHVAVTGGRSGMGALMALATNLYGADHLWHLWVKQEIEEGGTIDKLFGLTDPTVMATSPFLNPTVEGKEAYGIVDLPFLDLTPLHDALWEYKRTGKVLDLQPPLAQLFARAGIKRFTDVFPAGLTFGQFDQLLKLMADYPQATRTEQSRMLVKLGGILQQAGVVEADERQLLVDLINGQATAEAFFEMARAARKDRVKFWKWCVAHKDEVETALKIADFSVGLLGVLFTALELYLKAMGYIS